MKKIIYIAVSFCGLLFMNSCDESLLDSYTPGTFTEEDAVVSVSDLRRLMNGGYTSMIPVSEYTFNSVFTDEVSIGFANGGQGLGSDYVFNINSDSDSPNGIWVTNYVTIGIANRVIKDGTRLLVETPADELVIKGLMAEAYAVRAYCHNQLLSYFSTTSIGFGNAMRCDIVLANA